MRNGIIPVDSSGSAVRKIAFGGMTVTRARFRGFTTPRHAHERAMCTHTLRGRWVQDIRGRSLDCMPDTLLTKDAGESHVDRFMQPGIDVLMIEVERGRREELRPSLDMLIESQHVREDGVGPLAWRIALELDEPDDLAPIVVEGLVLELLGTAARRHSPRSDRPPPPWVERAKELLIATASRPARISEVANAINIHPVRLARAFRTFVGISPGGFVRRIRLDRAACELISTEHPLVDIAMSSGFADQSHFTRAFKRHTGLAPGQYRAVARERGRARGD
jgi:AraC family transcriptional regulator